MSVQLAKYILWISALFLLTACVEDSYVASSSERAFLAEKNRNNSTQDILIGLAWPFERQDYIRGAKLAIDEVNEAGGLNGRKVRLVLKDEADYRVAADIDTDDETRSSYQQVASQIAREFADNPNIVAVIGHHSSRIAVPAAITYSYHGILYVATTSTSPSLTVAGGPFVFQLLPDDRDMVKQIAGYAALSRFYGKPMYKRMVVLNERSKYGNDIATFFDEAANTFDIEIIARASFFKGKPDDEFVDYRSTLFPLRSLNFDAIFLIGGKTDAGRIVAQAREIGLIQPFLGMDVMENQEFLEAAGTAAEGTIVPSAFNESFNLAQPFISRFQRTYSVLPTTWSALAYDSIRLILHGITDSNYSTVPSVVANTIRYMDPWVSVTGVYQFSLDGRNRGKSFMIKEMDKGTFKTLPGAHTPYLLWRVKRQNRRNLMQLPVSKAGQLPPAPTSADEIPMTPVLATDGDLDQPATLTEGDSALSLPLETILTTTDSTVDDLQDEEAESTEVPETLVNPEAEPNAASEAADYVDNEATEAQKTAAQTSTTVAAFKLLESFLTPLTNEQHEQLSPVRNPTMPPDSLSSSQWHYLRQQLEQQTDKAD